MAKVNVNGKKKCIPPTVEGTTKLQGKGCRCIILIQGRKEMTTITPFTNEERIPKNLSDLLMITQFISRGVENQLFVLEF